MLANSRTASVNGRTMKVEENSIGVIRSTARFGTPAGRAMSLKYGPTPC